MIRDMATGFFLGVGIGARMFSTAIAAFLILWSAIGLVIGGHVLSERGIFARGRDFFTAPVKAVLPPGLARGKFDYAPLIAAIAFLIMGFGLERLCDILIAIVRTFS